MVLNRARLVLYAQEGRGESWTAPVISSSTRGVNANTWPSSPPGGGKPDSGGYDSEKVSAEVRSRNIAIP